MNRTIEQWNGVAEHVGNSLLIKAISDLQGLARQLEHVKSAFDEERAAWSKRRTELLRNHDAELSRRKAAEAQRDELLAVLEGLLGEVAGCMCAYEMPARAAIQKVRGGE